jgi:hypothetical protein
VKDLAHAVPLDLGSFNLLGWQFLWVLGLALGETTTRDPPWLRRHRGWLLIPSLLIVAAGILCRHRFGLQPVMVPNFAFWTDKWRLGPLRLANSIAWALLLWSWNPRPKDRWLAPTALLGRNSLAVFAAHIPLAIAATTAVQLFEFSRAAKTAIGFAVIAAMFAFAALIEYGARLPRAVRLCWNAARARIHDDKR